MRVVFMGTPEFAVPSLQALMKSDDHLVGVVTRPDRPKGRGHDLAASPVKRVAEQAGIPILQPLKMKDPQFLASLRQWQADMIVVAAFGRILPPVILSLPPQGCVNVHGSLLPKYRGAAPIQWAVINGESETGITTMLMDDGMDTGAILLQEGIPIAAADTTGTLTPRLADLGGRLLIETIRQLKTGTITPHAQDNSQATMAPLLKKEDGLIDWTLAASAIVNRIRGFSPWPGVYTFAGSDRWTIWRASVGSESVAATPGAVTEVVKDSIHVATGNGVLVVTEIQAANGRRMAVSQYLVGHSVKVGLNLGRSHP